MIVLTNSLSLGLVAYVSAAAASPGVTPTPVGSLELVEHIAAAPLVPKTGATISHHSFTLHGLPVRGASQSVLRGRDGRVRLVIGDKPSHVPALLPEQGVVSRAQLDAIVATLARPDQLVLPVKPELVYLLVLGHPLLAWEVTLPLSLEPPEPSRTTSWISAASGRVLETREHVVAVSQADVYAQNPVATPYPTRVQLEGLVGSGPGQHLDGTVLRALGCQLDEPDQVVSWWNKNACYPAQRVEADALGDFVVPTPDVKLVAQNLDGDDLYAELSMYYHGQRFFSFMSQKGVDGFACEMSTMVANYRYRQPSVGYPELPYGPLNNAYYTNDCDPTEGPTMLFGQGSDVDFAFDADVIYHELGHGIVEHVSPDGLWTKKLRPEAVVVDALGINEALADYHTMMLTDAPELGDYVARYWPSYARAYIRTGENQKRCPEHMEGQSHNDGEPVAGALWSVRARIGAILDEVVLEALAMVPPDVEHEQLAAMLLALARVRVEDGSMTAEAFELLDRALEARGLLSCPRVLRDPDEVAKPRSLHLRKSDDAVLPFYPGPMQLGREIPNGSDNIVLTYRLEPKSTSTGNPNENPVAAKVLIKRGATPIEFSYDLVVIDEAREDGSPSVRELLLVGGDWDLELEPRMLAEAQWQVVVRGLKPGQWVYLTLVNLESSDAVARDVMLTSVPSGDLDHGTRAWEPEDYGTTDEGRSEETSSEASSGPAIERQDVEITPACACSQRDTSSWPRRASGLWIALLIVTTRRRRACPTV